MSAYIVDDKTINRIVAHLSYNRRDQDRFIRQLDQDGLPNEPEALGTALFGINAQAVGARYPHESIETLPGTIAHYEYAYTPTSPTRMQAAKSLHCWLYQCSEGDAPETPLFKAIAQISHQIDHEIVTGLPEYETAEWA